MTVSDPGAGQQQGREANDGPSADGHHEVSGQCFACLVGVSSGPESHGDRCPSPTPPARDSGREGCTCDAPLSSCTPGCPCTSCDALRDSGRDEAREAVARWLRDEIAETFELRWTTETYLRMADRLLALPEMDKLLRRPA